MGESEWRLRWVGYLEEAIDVGHRVRCARLWLVGGELQLVGWGRIGRFEALLRPA